MKTTVVLGATGMLGHKVCQTLASSGHRVIGCLRGELGSARALEPVFEGVELVGGLDVLAGDDLEREIERLAPDVVVNAVGLVKQLDEADDPYLAVAINSLLPHRLARVSDRVGARLVQISTDCVFDGRKGAYVETDLPDAQDLYGRSKVLGETTMNEPAALTLRTSFIGRELTAPKHGLLEWFLGQAGGRVRGFAGVVYTGLTSRELASVVELLVDSDPGLAGVYHVASAPITKLELLELIRAVYELDIDIEEVAEPRSDRSLVMGPFTQATGYQAPAWDQMVLDMYDDPTPYDDLARKAEVIERE